MAAVRLTPPVRAWRWRSAPAGSAKPRISSRLRAASGVSRSPSAGTRATDSSSGR